MTTTLPQYVVTSKSIDVRIATLQLERHSYDNYPEYQREKVWSYTMKRMLIDTIQRGLPIPAILVIWKDHCFLVVDGQQRLTTIFEFLADGFATSRLREDPALEPLEPNKRFSQLSGQSREAIENYTIQIRVIDQQNEPHLGALFRRLQHQQPLSLGERLWSYSSDARQSVSRLIEHPIWREIYIGKLTRKRAFLGSLYLLLIELDHGYTNITQPRLRDVVTGARDGLMRSELIEAIWKRLDDVRHVFADSLFLSMGEVVPLYQAVLFLEQYECDLKKSERGCLSPWYTQVKDSSLRARHTPGQTDLLAKIIHSKHQVEFWAQELPRMLATIGLRKINKKRSFSTADRMKAWERQNGLCPVCKQAVKPTDQGHHVVHFAQGGATDVDNCQIVHEECHKRMHDLMGITMEIIKVDDENP